MIEFSKYFEIAEKANLEASEFLGKNFGTKKEMTHKSGGHYGISEDLKSNEIYENFLKKMSPEVALYTEEGERNLENDLVWVVDPIEGTSNYRSGNPFWASQIALLYKNEPVLGIVNAPILKQKFSAIKGKGAFLNEKRIMVTDLTDFKHALIDMGRGTEPKDKEWFVDTLAKLGNKLRTTRSFGSTGLGISFTAAGITDIYMSCGSHLYDYAPGVIIAREAGGAVFDLKGNDWKLSDEGGIIISNRKLVEEVLKVI